MRIKTIVCAAALTTLSLSSSAESLKVLNWEAYLSEPLVEKWKKDTRNEIDFIYFDNDEKRDEILLNANHYSIDLAVVDEVIAERFGEAGRLVEITEENVPALSDMGTFWRQRCTNFAVPYLWGTLGIIYRSDVVKTPPESWAEILTPKEALKGHIGMLSDHTDLLAPALFMNDEPLNTEEESALKKAFNDLKTQTPHVLTYEYPVTFISSNEQADQLHMAVAYGGDQHAINELIGQEGLWKYAIPKEGTVLWIDCLAVPANSAKKETALSFINYLSQAQNSAENALDLHFATPNEAAIPLLPEAFRTNKGIFPEHTILQQSGLYEVLSNANIEQRLRISNAIINIHETQQAR